MQRREAGPSRSPRWLCLPTINRAVLNRLRRDLGENILRSFVHAYLDLLPGRLAELEAALRRHDAADADRVALKLRSSSTMVGATHLSELVAMMQTFLRHGKIDDAAELLGRVVRREADKAAEQLREPAK